MKGYPCRGCGKLKPAEQVMTLFKTFNSPVERIRWRKCDECQKTARKGYRKGQGHESSH